MHCKVRVGSGVTTMDIVRVVGAMEPHHRETIKNLTEAFREDPKVLGLLLGGSIAHGFAKADSDVDVTFIVTADEMARRQAEGVLHYNNRSLCTYDGYIDGKFADLAFLEAVAARGSEPARYAFEGNQILFNRTQGLEALLAKIVRYPIEEKQSRKERFAAQLLAWRWYYTQGVRQDSPYLIGLALQRIILFSTRLVLAENELLFPYHKWMLKVLEGAARRPEGMLQTIARLHTDHDWPMVDHFCRNVLEWAGFIFEEADKRWPTHFLRDTELRWMREEPAIDEL